MRKIIVAALGAFGGTLGYGYILNAPKNTILPASFIGLAGYIVYILLGMAGFGTMSAYFFSTVFVSVVCELLARKMRTPSTIFLLGALVPLVPGYNFYLAMLALVENLQRRDLDYIEEAEGLQKLMQQYHLSQEQAARRIGKSQSAVANKLRILRHPPSVLQGSRRLIRNAFAQQLICKGEGIFILYYFISVRDNSKDLLICIPDIYFESRHPS